MEGESANRVASAASRPAANGARRPLPPGRTISGLPRPPALASDGPGPVLDAANRRFYI